MGTTPTTTNVLTATIQDIIDEAVMTLALNAATSAIEADVPVLDLPVIKQIFELALKECFSFIDKALDQIAALQTMDAETNAEAAAYQGAVTTLQTALDSGDQNAINTASQSFATTLGSLIHYDGS